MGSESAMPGSRSQRFLIEFVAITIGVQLGLTWLMSLVREPYPGSNLTLRIWVPAIGLAIAEWAVLRRYVPWAQWWALAVLAGSGAPSQLTLNYLYRLMAPANGVSQAALTFATFGAAAVAALLQYPTLRGRVPRAWVWLIAAPAAAILGRLASGWVMPFQTGQTGIEPALTLVARTAIRAVPIAIVTGVTLMWLCREWIDRPAAPRPSRPYTRVEFLIAWCAVPMTAWALLAVLDGSLGRSPQLGLVVLPVIFVSMLAAGELWVLAGTAVNFRRWRLVTLLGVGAVVAIALPVPLFANVLYIAVLVTRAGGLGLIPALAQSFAFSSPARGALWLVAAVVGWTTGYWLPTLVSNSVGPGNAWRYSTFSEPALFGLVAGLLTGLALLPEITLREPENP